MDKKYLSKLTIGGNQYDLKDAEARQDIIDIKSSITGAMHWLGYTTSELTDGSTINPVVIDGENVTAKAGDVVAIIAAEEGKADLEFVFSGSKWQEYGSTGSLKALAFKENASGDVECAGSNAASAVSFAGTASETVLKAIDSAAVAPSFTEGSFNQGTLPSFTEGEFNQGTLPSFTEGEFNAGSLPSLGDATTSAFATEGVTATVNEESETLIFTDASTSNAVTAQGTFNAGSLPSKGADTFSAGTLPSKDADTFSAGTLPTKDADVFNAGSAATFTTQSVITDLGTATAAAQVFSGATVSVTVA